MTTHIMALTYQPKIEAVFDGKITQTIRTWYPGQPEKRVGDKLILHTWEGKPYRSKWGQRMVGEISQVEVLHLSIASDERLDELARMDGIDPPNGKELKRTLANLNHGWLGEYRVIRWKVL